MISDVLISTIRQMVETVQAHTILLTGKDSACLPRQTLEAFELEVAEVSETSAGSPSRPRYDLILCLGLPGQPAEQALETLCHYSDTILFDPNPSPASSSLPPSDYWVECFARLGFFRNLAFETPSGEAWPACFQRNSLNQGIAAYERRLRELTQANQLYQVENAQLRHKLAGKEELILAAETRLARFEGSLGWALLQKMQSWRSRLSPPGSVRDQVLEDLFRAYQGRDWKRGARGIQRLGGSLAYQVKKRGWELWLRLRPPRQGRLIQVEALLSRPPVEPHQETVDIIICVHNALNDVQRCLDSLERHTFPPYTLILIDDGSESETSTYLAQFAQAHPSAVLLRNEVPQGYTLAANQGLRQVSANYALLLNSDTVVTAGWLDRLIACANSQPRIGLAGPLSNTASWQSIPEVMEGADWADNPLPPGVTLDDMGCLVAHSSARLYPSIPFLNGFCLLVRRELIQEIGYFDEETFGAGYGEENDYILRARQAGWQAVLADDTYVYHAQSRSYSHERRKRLSERAGLLLARKHGSSLISQGLAICRQDRVLEGIRTRSKVMLDRQEWIKRGRAEFGGRSLLFVLPILSPGGGGNVIINEALAMREMGVTVELFNLTPHQAGFEQSYPDLAVPVRYGAQEDLVVLGERYDAVVATTSATVAWLAPLVARERQSPALGYYIQEFEPYMYPPDSTEFQTALASYTLIPGLTCFTKTDWTRQEVKTRTGVVSKVVGPSLNIDLFRPCPRSEPAGQDRPLKIVAMVRLRPAYRSSRLTMEILRKTAHHYGTQVEIVIFGVSLEDPGFAQLPHDFAWSLAGILTQKQIAALLNEADIFVDFSSHQAMGLTALEAMACGAAVVVPARGGSTSFARHEENSLIVDTASSQACWQAVQRLVEDHPLRSHLQHQALVDVCRFFPERAAFHSLATLFGMSGSDAL